MDPSIVDYLNSKGQASDFNSRAALAAKYGISNYTGTAAQNGQLLKVIQAGGTPTISPSPIYNLPPNPIAPQQSGITQTSTSTGGPPSNYNPNYSIPSSTVSSLRSQIQNGQISTAQAQQQIQQQLQSQVNSGAINTGQYSSLLSSTLGSIFSNLGPIRTPDGRSATVDGSGNVSYTSTQVNNTNVGGSGVSSSSTNVLPGGVAMGSSTGGTGTANPYGSPATGYFPTYAQATAAANALMGGGSSSSGQASSNVGATGNGTVGGGNTAGSGSTGGITGLANSLISSGYTIPASLQITPALISTFLSFAHQVVDPQTQQALSTEIAGVNNDLQNQQTQYELSQGQTVQDFGTQLSSQDNQAGSNGTAFSGQRQLSDNNLVNSTNRSLQGLASNAAYNASNSLQQGAAAVGSANAGQFNLPTFATGSVSTGGSQLGSYNAGGNASLNYNPSLYTAGTIPSMGLNGLGGQNNLNSLEENYLTQYGTLAGNNSNGTRSISDIIGMMSGLPSGYTVPSNLT